jgi:hypothetical protein
MFAALVMLVTTALPASGATIEVYPEHRQAYQRTFLLLRDAVDCRLPSTARGPSDTSGRGVRVTLDDFAVYETGQVEHGGSEARTLVAYGDPDDVVVSLPASSGTSRTIQAVVECRSIEGEWREVGRTTYPSVNGAGATPQRMPLSDPVLSGPLTFPCLEGRCGRNPMTMAVDGREIPDRNATRPEAGQSFDVLRDLEPGVRLLEVAGTGWRETFPVIGAFAAGPPSPLTTTGPAPALGAEVTGPVPWGVVVVLGLVALGLLAVVVAVWRGRTGGRGRRAAIGLGLVSFVAVMVAVVVILPATGSRPAADRDAADLRTDDPQCCPTGRALTDWTYGNGLLSPAGRRNALPKLVEFSPFGLGVLDLLVAEHVYREVVRTGEALVVEDFFHETSRCGEAR